MGILSDIGNRLAEERNRQGLTQTQLAGLAGVTRKTVFGYESGQRAPDGGAMSIWAAAGLDVLYILTGQRAAAPPAPVLSREHAALIDNYNHCAPDDQAAIRRLASTAAQPRARRSRGA